MTGVGLMLLCVAAAFSLIVVSAHMDSSDDRVPFLWTFLIVGGFTFAGSWLILLPASPQRRPVVRATLAALVIGGLGGISVWGYRHIDEQRTIDMNRRIIDQQNKLNAAAAANLPNPQP